VLCIGGVLGNQAIQFVGEGHGVPMW
jgi:hypothetical protein